LTHMNRRTRCNVVRSFIRLGSVKPECVAAERRRLPNVHPDILLGFETLHHGHTNDEQGKSAMSQDHTPIRSWHRSQSAKEAASTTCKGKPFAQVNRNRC